MKSLTRLCDGQAWPMQMVMLLTLGRLVDPREMIPGMNAGSAISMALIFVARPIGLLISPVPFHMSFPKRVLILWVGLRGAGPIVLLTYPMMAGIEHAGLIFNIVLNIVITSVPILGTKLPLVVRWLDVDRPASSRSLSPYDLKISPELRREPNRSLLPLGGPAIGKTMIGLHIPLGAPTISIEHNGVHIFPSGITSLQA